MINKVLMLVAVVGGFLAIGTPLSAHHGDAAYDESKPVVLKACTGDGIRFDEPPFADQVRL